VIAVTLQAADQGDTTTIHETLGAAGVAVAQLIEREAERTPEAKPQVHVHGIKEIVTDKGYHSGKTVLALEQVEARSYIPEPKRPRRKWDGKTEEQQAVYANRRRVKGSHGKAAFEKTWGVARTILCPLLRNWGDETNPSSRPRKHSEAAIDSRVCVQPKPDLPTEFGRRDTAGTTKPTGHPNFGFYVVACRTYGARKGHRTPSAQFRNSKPPPTGELSPLLPQTAISEEFGGCNHGLSRTADRR
jgi:hypothetical protein